MICHFRNQHRNLAEIELLEPISQPFVAGSGNAMFIDLHQFSNFTFFFKVLEYFSELTAKDYSGAELKSEYFFALKTYSRREVKSGAMSTWNFKRTCHMWHGQHFPSAPVAVAVPLFLWHLLGSVVFVPAGLEQ